MQKPKIQLKNKHTAVRRGILVLLAVGFLIFTVLINQVEKVPIISTQGQTFEKAVVTQIVKDNVQEDGSRTGEQKILVRMQTGEHKGEILQTTSSSGFLFGAACKVGMQVIVMQSVSGQSTVTSVYAQDREWVIYLLSLIHI